MKIKKIAFIIITFTWVAVIFSFSLQPATVSGNLSGPIAARIWEFFIPGIENNPALLETLHFVFRKCAHFSEYFILGILSMLTLRQIDVRHKDRWGICFCALVASVDETIQIFVEGRDGNVLDVLLDSAGAAVGIAAVILCIGFFAKKRNKQRKCEKTIKKQ